MSRVIAAFLIMLLHSPNVVVAKCGEHLFFCGQVAFFLVLAGYFAARNITWHKAWNRALWLFIPFILWNIIGGIYTIIRGNLGWSVACDWSFWLGVRDIFVPGWNPLHSPEICIAPPIGASWFLRDIILLSLVTPWLVKIKRLLFVAILLLYSFSSLPPMWNVTLSLGTCAFYMLDVFFCTYSISDIYKFLETKLNRMLPLCFLLPVIAILSPTCCTHWHETPLGLLLGLMLIMYTGMLIAKYLPRLTQWTIMCTPACFLIFMLNLPIYNIVQTWTHNDLIMLFLPVLVFSIIVGGYFLLKRLFPYLLPYLAYVNYPRKK